MNINDLSFDLGNIVLLFENMKDAKVSRDTILGLFSSSSQHVDIGPVFMVRYPDEKVEVYVFFDENRVETKMVNPGTDDWKKICKAASQVYKAISGVSLKAFGFNYFAEVPTNEESDEFLIKNFKSSLEPLESQINGKIFSVATTIKYLKNETTHQLNIGKSVKQNSLSLRLNVHYDKSELFEENALTKNYIGLKDEFVNTISKLFT